MTIDNQVLRQKFWRYFPFLVALGVAVSFWGFPSWIRQIAYAANKDLYVERVLTISSVEEKTRRDGKGRNRREAIVVGTILDKPVKVQASSLLSPSTSISQTRKHYANISTQSVLVASEPVLVPVNDIDITVLDFETYHSLSWPRVAIRFALWNAILLGSLIIWGQSRIRYLVYLFRFRSMTDDRS